MNKIEPFEVSLGMRGNPITVVRKARKPKFDEGDHPRDRVGRFIETGAEVRIFGGGTGRVVGNVGNGRIEVERADGRHVIVHRNYLTVTQRPDGAAPTDQPDDAPAPLAVQEVAVPDAEEIDAPASPVGAAAQVRDDGAELADAVAEQFDSPDLVDEIRSRTTAYQAAVTNGVPDDEADERAALLATLDAVTAQGGTYRDIADLVASVRTAAMAEPPEPGSATGAQPDGAAAHLRTADGNSEAWLRTDEGDTPVGYIRDNTTTPPRTVRYTDAEQWAADADAQGMTPVQPDAPTEPTPQQAPDAPGATPPASGAPEAPEEPQAPAAPATDEPATAPDAAPAAAAPDAAPDAEPTAEPDAAPEEPAAETTPEAPAEPDVSSAAEPSEQPQDDVANSPAPAADEPQAEADPVLPSAPAESAGPTKLEDLGPLPTKAYRTTEEAEAAGYVFGGTTTDLTVGEEIVAYSRGRFRTVRVAKIGRTNATVEYTTEGAIADNLKYTLGRRTADPEARGQFVTQSARSNWDYENRTANGPKPDENNIGSMRRYTEAVQFIRDNPDREAYAAARGEAERVAVAERREWALNATPADIINTAHKTTKVVKLAEIGRLPAADRTVEPVPEPEPEPEPTGLPDPTSSIENLRAYYRSGEIGANDKNRAFLAGLADEPSLTLSSTGDLAMYKSSPREWIIMDTRTGLSLGPLSSEWGGQKQAAALMEKYLAATEGFDWSNAKANLLEWRNSDGLALGPAMMKTKGKHDLDGGKDTYAAQQYREQYGVTIEPEPAPDPAPVVTPDPEPSPVPPPPPSPEPEPSPVSPTPDPSPPPPPVVVPEPEPEPETTGAYADVPDGTLINPDQSEAPITVHPEGAALVMYTGDGVPLRVTSVGVRNNNLTGWGQVVQHEDGSYGEYSSDIVVTDEAFASSWHVFDGDGKLIAGGGDVPQTRAQQIADRFNRDGHFGDSRGPFRVAQGFGEPAADEGIEFTDSPAGDLAAGDRIDMDGVLVSVVSTTRRGNDLEIEYRAADGTRGTMIADRTEVLRKVGTAAVKDDAELPEPTVPEAAREQQVLVANLAAGDRIWLGNRTAVIVSAEPTSDTDVYSVTVRWPDRTTETATFGRDAVLDRADNEFLPDPPPLDRTVPQARPVLYTYQRRNLVALGWDRHENAVAAEAAQRIRTRQPLSALHSAALAQALVDEASQPGVKAQRQRSLLRLAASLNAASIEAGGRGVDLPEIPGSDRATRTAVGEFTAGDQLVFVGADGKPVSGKVTGVRRMMGGRLFQVTYTDASGNETTVLLTKNTQAYLLPDLPEPTPVRVPDGPREHIDMERVRVGDVVHIPADNRTPAGDYEVLEVGESERGEIQFRIQRPLEFGDSDMNWIQNLSGPTVVRVSRGEASADQPRDADMAEENPTEIAYNEAAVGDRVTVDGPYGQVTGLVIKIEEVRAGDSSGRDLQIRKDDGSGTRVAVWQTSGKITRLVENDVNAFERVEAAKLRLREASIASAMAGRLAGVMSDVRKAHMERVRLALYEELPRAGVTDERIETVLSELQMRSRLRLASDIELLGTNLTATFTGEGPGGDRYRAYKPLLDGLAQEALEDHLERLTAALRDVRPTSPGESRVAAMIDYVGAQQDSPSVEMRDVGTIARSLLQARRAIEGDNGSTVDREVPDLPEGADLRTRMDAYRNSLPSTFGTQEKVTKSYTGFDLDALERGELPEVVEAPLAMSDTAADSGPGEETMRQLSVVLAAGRDLDSRMQQLMREIDPSLPENADNDLVQWNRDKVTFRAEYSKADKAYEKKRKSVQADEFVARGITADPGQRYHTPVDAHMGQLSRAEHTERLHKYKIQGGDRTPETQAKLEAATAEVQRLREIGADVATAVSKHPEVVPLLKQRNDYRDKWLDFAQRADNMSARIAAARARAARRTLAEVRDLGGTALEYSNRKGQTLTERGALVKAMRFAESNYPTEWLDKAKARGRRIQVDQSTRGWYKPWSREMRLSKDHGKVDGVPVSGRVATHELGHEMEAAIPGLMAAEKALLWSRSAEGEIGSRKLQRTTVTDGKNVYGDEFPESYTGKVYDGSFEAYEVFTTGVESVLAGSTYADENLRQWVLGVMALL